MPVTSSQGAAAPAALTDATDQQQGSLSPIPSLVDSALAAFGPLGLKNPAGILGTADVPVLQCSTESLAGHAPQPTLPITGSNGEVGCKADIRTRVLHEPGDCSADAGTAVRKSCRPCGNARWWRGRPIRLDVLSEFLSGEFGL